MTHDEKMALSQAISQLPNEKLSRIVEIIKERMPLLKNEDDQEIEIGFTRRSFNGDLKPGHTAGGAAGRPRRRRGRFGPVWAFQRAERTSDG